MTYMPEFWDRTGKPITMTEWGRLQRDLRYRRIGHDTINTGTELYTTWLGMNLTLGADPPNIFETMVFHGEESEEMGRYPTAEEAQEGHRRALSELLAAEMCQALLDDDGDRVDALVPRLQALGLDL